jgi:hypothetical protein
MRADKLMRRLGNADPARRLKPMSPVAREELRQSITAAPLSGPRSPRRAPRRRLVLLGAGLLAVVVAAGAGAWALGERAGETTTLMCALEPDSGSGISSATGDPVADCQAEWRRLFRSPPPKLIAYEAGGNITVVPAGTAVPADWKPLAADFRQNADLIELDERLSDSASGLDSRCYSLQEARTLVQRLLAASDLEGWTVVNDPNSTASKDSCTAYALDPESRQVVLSSHEALHTPSDAPHLVFARRVAGLVARECLSLEAAAEQVRREAATFGWHETDSTLIINSLEGVGCADIVVNVGGRVEVTIRGESR